MTLRRIFARPQRGATATLAAIALAAGLTTTAPAQAATSTTQTTAAKTSTTPTTAQTTAQTDAQALAQAKKTGKAVPITATETASSALTANPNGTLTLTESDNPVRAKVGGTWQPLNADLVRNADGSYSPALSAGPLRLSGGGAGALATMAQGTDKLGLTLPTDLPVPTISGASATYANVAPGVTLVVTANTLGGFSDTFVVADATAAASPALARLLTATTDSTGLTVKQDGTALAAVNHAGQPVFAASTPAVWDSATTAAPSGSTAPSSSVAAPGRNAHTGLIATKVSGKTLTLSPDASILGGATAEYPIFVDPVWNPTETSAQGWSTVAEEYPTTKHWDTTPESAGYMAVGYGESDYSLWARSMVNFPLSHSELAGSTISSAVFSVTDEYAGACYNGDSDEGLDVDAPSQTLNTSNDFWDDWDTSGDVGPTIGSAIFAYGYAHATGATCSSEGNPGSASVTLSTSTFTNDVNSGKTTQTLALVAANESSEYGWKDLIPNTAQLTLIYDMTPQITGATTNDQNCGTATAPALVGLGSVNLTAGVYQNQGSGLTADYRLYNSAKTVEYNPLSTTAGTTTSPSAIAATSGTNATFPVSENFFTEGFGTTTETTFAWTVSTTDNTLTSGAKTCYFTYDPETPGAPTIDDSASVLCQNTTLTYTIGTAAKFALTPAAGTSSVTSYTYQLNSGAPLSINANGNDATISVTPAARLNILTVYAIAAGTNEGQPQVCTFSAKLGAVAADKDLTGTGLPDLVVTGANTAAMSPGLWEANETSTNGSIQSSPSDIGTSGNGLTTGASAFNGSQAVTGAFSDDNFQDVLTYNPSTGNGVIDDGTGDGGVLQTQNQADENSITDGTLTDTNSDNPLQLANAYDSAASGLAYPDLIGTSGDSGNGYYLEYYPNSDGITAFGATDPIYSSFTPGGASTLLATPAGGTDWNHWVITTAQISGQTDMYLWDSVTDALYLWTDFTVTGCDTACIASPSQTEIDTDFNPGTVQSLEAANFTETGAYPDLWAVTTSGVVTAYTLTGLSAADFNELSTGSQTLNTATNSWALNDTPTDGTSVSTTAGAADTAASGTTALTLTASGTGPTWNTGDLFSPDVAFDSASSTATGDLTTSAKAIDLTGSFTISVWAKPAAYGGAVLSQFGADDSGMTLTDESSGWNFSLNTGAGTTDTYNTISGGAVELNAWSNIVATFNAGTRIMNLYVDGVFVATGSHTAPTTGATGDFVVGFDGASGTYFKGQIAQIETTTSSVLAPAQNYATPGYHQSITDARVLDTRSGIGTTTVQNSTCEAGDTSLTNGTTSASTPVAANSTTTLQISGDKVCEAGSTSTTVTIPTTVTAVGIDVTLTGESSSGFLAAYADGTQRPITSATNYTASTTVTGYQVVPVGPDGKIAIYNSSPGTTALIVDITGYYTSNYSAGSAQIGDQTYYPEDTPYRLLDTRSSVANTSLSSTGTVAAGTTFTLQITGGGVGELATSDGADTIAINITTAGQTGGGFVEAFATGDQPAAGTTVSYTAGDAIADEADVPISSSGSVSFYVSGSATDVIVDISGYFAANTGGETYHTTAPTRLVDTRSGIGGSTGAVTSDYFYGIDQSAINQITNATDPTLAMMLTTTGGTASGNLIAFSEALVSNPESSNVNWNTGATESNLAVVSESTTNGESGILVYNQSAGTVQLVVDCSGYFSNN